MPERIETTTRRFRGRTDTGEIVTGTQTLRATIFIDVQSGRQQRLSEIYNIELNRDDREVERDAFGNLRFIETGEIIHIIEWL